MKVISVSSVQTDSCEWSVILCLFKTIKSIVRSIPSAVPPSGQVQGDHWGWDREGDCWRWDREGVCWRWDWEVDYWRQRCRRNCHPVLQGPCHKVIKQ